MSDGTNFEGSTSYHCLSTDLLFWALAVYLNIKEQRWIELIALVKKRRFFNAKKIFLNSLLFDLRNQSDLKTELTDLLEKIITFIVAISLPSGDILQIGDNDSGSLIKIDALMRSGLQTYCPENLNANCLLKLGKKLSIAKNI